MHKKKAFTKDPLIYSLLMGYYRFNSLSKALDQLAIIKKQYTTSQHALHICPEDSAILWIKGYRVTEEEKKQGIVGHFVRITCKKISASHWEFNCEKLMDSAPHPEKHRTNARHPNWGHPILRSVKKKRIYSTVQAAHAELIALQEEYPEASIPGHHSLSIGIYGQTGDKNHRVKRYNLEILPLVEGGVQLVATEKTPKAKPLITAPKLPQGYFSSKITLKRKPSVRSNKIIAPGETV